MKSPLPFLALMLCASVALAEPPAAPDDETGAAASELVNKQLLAPMKKSESRRKSFSRAMPVPVSRRVRVLDTEALTDARGKRFVRFAIDVRRAFDEQGAWQKDSMLGCAYPEEREVYVQDGSAYVSARNLLSAGAKARADVCRPAPVLALQTAQAEP
jgi:hypothetical protein